MSDIVVDELEIAVEALRTIRRLIENNACSLEPQDTTILRKVTELLPYALHGAVGALAVAKQRQERVG